MRATYARMRIFVKNNTTAGWTTGLVKEPMRQMAIYHMVSVIFGKE
jgi:hypothetical protein